MMIAFYSAYASGSFKRKSRKRQYRLLSISFDFISFRRLNKCVWMSKIKIVKRWYPHLFFLAKRTEHKNVCVVLLFFRVQERCNALNTFFGYRCCFCCFSLDASNELNDFNSFNKLFRISCENKKSQAKRKLFIWSRRVTLFVSSMTCLEMDCRRTQHWWRWFYSVY